MTLQADPTEFLPEGNTAFSPHPAGETPYAEPSSRRIDLDQALREAVRIDETRISDEFVRLPSDLAFFGAEYARASKAFAMAKVGLSRVEALLMKEYRTTLSMRGRVTESQVEAAVRH